MNSISLPIDEQKNAIISALEKANQLLVKAEPGAGKTTKVPLFCFEALTGGILVLEPRRVACRLSAEYLSAGFDQKVGETIGYRMRFESKVSSQTRITFITEGLFLKILNSNRNLNGISAVIIDEFHERSLNTDLALAIVCQLQQTSRPDLRLVVMSATLGLGALQDWLPMATTIEAKGRVFPVQVSYQYPLPGEGVDQQITRASRENSPSGDILVFLATTAEILQVEQKIATRIPDYEIIPLTSELANQSLPRILAGGKKKIILATNIAETSITLPRVTLVIDGGWQLQSRIAPWSGLNFLEKKRISKDSADQRAGRAGRVQEGRCIRLYDERDYNNRAEFRSPEIRRADLSQTLLELFNLGLVRFEDHRIKTSFQWFEDPDEDGLRLAITTLEMLGAIDESGITDLGLRIAKRNFHPRLGAMIEKGAELNLESLSAWLACYIAEGGPGNLDLASTANAWQGGLRTTAGLEAVERAYRNLGFSKRSPYVSQTLPINEAAAEILLAGFPDRVGKLLPRGGQLRSSGRWQAEYSFFGGKSGVAEFDETPPSYIVVLDAAEISVADSKATRIRLASPLHVSDLVKQKFYRTETVEEWSEKSGSLVVLEKDYYGNLLMEEKIIGKKSIDLTGTPRLLQEVKKIWPHGFSDCAVLERYHAVIAMLDRKRIKHEYPKIEGDFLDLLLSTLVDEQGDFNKIKSQKIASLLEEHLGWQLWQNFCKDFPAKIKIPSGREIDIHYEEERDPWIEAKLQEFFSAKESPTISPHRIKITIHLLSPAGRPLQVTSDLSGFWQGSYREVQKQMKSRYPKHPWPDNPEQYPPIIKGRAR